MEFLFIYVTFHKALQNKSDENWIKCNFTSLHFGFVKINTFTVHFSKFCWLKNTEFNNSNISWYSVPYRCLWKFDKHNYRWIWIENKCVPMLVCLYEGAATWRSSPAHHQTCVRYIRIRVGSQSPLNLLWHLIFFS